MQRPSASLRGVRNLHSIEYIRRLLKVRSPPSLIPVYYPPHMYLIKDGGVARCAIRTCVNYG